MQNTLSTASPRTIPFTDFTPIKRKNETPLDNKFKRRTPNYNENCMMAANIHEITPKRVIIPEPKQFFSFASVANNILYRTNTPFNSKPPMATQVQPFNFALDKRIKTEANDAAEDKKESNYFKALELNKRIFNPPRALVKSKSVTTFKEFNLSKSLNNLQLDDFHSEKVIQEFAIPQPIRPEVLSKKVKYNDIKYKSTSDLKQVIAHSKIQTPLSNFKGK
jgi:hypothetical protein